MQSGVPASDRTCILVVGMHRSGTSAITRVLSLLGGALPRHLMPPAPNNNALGFWEPLPLAKLHDRMLAEAGSAWDDWRRFSPEDQLPPDRLADYRDRLTSEIEDSYGGEPLFVLKDPRICRFVPLYRQILGSMGIAVRPVLALRDHAAVVASLRARDAIPEDVGRLYWLRHLLDAEAATRDLPRAIVRYESLLDDWRVVVRAITSDLDLVWPQPVEDAASEIDAFLSRDHDHSSRLTPEADTDRPSDWFQRCADAFRRLPAAAAMTDLDALAGEFEPMARIFGPTLGSERAARKKALASQQSAMEAAMAALRADHAREVDALRETLFEQRTSAAAAAAEAAQAIHAERNHHANAVRAVSRLERELQDFERFGLRWLFKRLVCIQLRLVGRGILPRPLRDLTVAGEDLGGPMWRISGDDPQFDLDWGTGASLPSGRYRLTLVTPNGSPRARRARLSVDAGSGCSEAGAIDLTFVPSRPDCSAADFVLPQGACSLRLDPGKDQPVFSLGKVRLRRR